jgi:hypothetical protein
MLFRVSTWHTPKISYAIPFFFKKDSRDGGGWCVFNPQPMTTIST